MKKLNRHKILSAACIAALPLLVVACLEFDGIIQPGRALTDSEIEVTAQLRVSPGEDGSGKVVFAVLAPKAWNLRDNATLYLTTKDYNAIQNQPEVVNEQLTLMPAEEKDPKNGLSWADSFMSVIGRGGNDPQTAMEWVVWRSSTTFIFDDKIEVDGQEVETADVHADVRIRMKTGAVPLTCELGYSYCYDTFGLKRDEQRFAEAFKPIETYNQVFTATPSVFRYGDVFGITFSHGGTALKDAGEVYLCGTAIHDGGQKAEVSAAVPRNRMELISSRVEKSLYPKEFFGLPSDAVIEELYFYFINADGSIVVKDDENGGQEFFVEQSDE